MIDELGIIRHARDLADEMRHDEEVRGTLLALCALADRLKRRAADWQARYEDLARLAGAWDTAITNLNGVHDAEQALRTAIGKGPH